MDDDGCFGIGGEPALILRDVNFAVRSGEVMAILGSKGSGKRALLDVVSHRVESKYKGHILLNGVPLTKSLFQNRCAYVSQDPYFIPGLTVAQTLNYTPTRVSFINIKCLMVLYCSVILDFWLFEKF